MDVQLVRGAGDVTGYGYSIAPRAQVLEGVPTGPAIQYDFGFHGLRYPSYPRDWDVQNSDQRDTVALPVDGAVHHWSLVVEDRLVNASIDGRSIPGLIVSPECSRSLFFRVWSAQVQFTGLAISKIHN